MRRTALVIAVLAALVSPGAAQGITRLQVAQREAEAAHPNACGHVSLFFASEAALGVDARASACVVTLATTWPRWWRSRLCDVMVHEYGHLAGLGHSTNPADNMSPEAPPHPRCAWIYRAETRLDGVRTEIADNRDFRRTVDRKERRRINRRIARLKKAAARIVTRIGR